MKTVFFSALGAALIALALPAHALIISYSYDAAGRLRGVDYGGASNTAYAYDANGNLLARTNTVNPFIPLLGRYTGLVTGGTPTALNTGLLTLAVASNGAFSGTLRLGGATYKLNGTFDANGAAMLNLTRKKPPGTLTLDLQLDLDGPAQITGTLSGAETATLVAVLTPFGKKSPAPGGLAGAYTALFEPTQIGAAIPKGDGFATVNVSAAGAVKVAGALADGAKISLGTVLAGDGTFTLFAGLYKNAGFLAGTVTFAADPGVSDFTGAPDWLKPAAFTTKLALLGSRYTAPSKGARALDFANASPNAQFHAEAGNLAAPLDKLITLETTNKFTIPAGPEKLKLKLTLPAGLLGGSFLDSGHSRKLSGVVFQAQNLGAGFFPGTSESGVFTLTPSP